MIIVSGVNHYHQLGKNSDFENFCNFPIIYPPKKLTIDPNSILSYSIYYQHAVLIKKDGSMQGVGFNQDSRISGSLSRNILSDFTDFSLKDEQGRSLTPVSAYTALSSTTYIVKNGQASEIYYCNNRINDGDPLFVSINGRSPKSLFGGFQYSACIDDEGKVILIYPAQLLLHPKEPLFAVSLPNNEKAVSLACTFEKILALSSSGNVYESKVSLKDKLFFTIVEELTDKEIVEISGTQDFCYAVSEEGKVFICGKRTFNISNNEEENVGSFNEFTLVKSLEKYKIKNAFAGSEHSLFLTEKGKVIACGNNNCGQLLQDTELDYELGDYPIETIVKSGATFCIAGHGISVVFVDCEPPQNIPNKRIESQKVERKSSSKKVENKKKISKQDLQVIDISEINNFTQKKLIGRGGQSQVFKVVSDQIYALKEFQIIGSMSENTERMRRFLQEYQAISMLNHPNIIKTYGICFGDEEHAPSILLEFCPTNLSNSIGELFDWQRITVIFEICLAMNEIHKLHLIHRDLKPENILLNDFKHVKISDFGISRLSEKYDEEEEEGEQPTMTLGIGTLKFLAPEILNEEKHYNNKVDVYAFGVVLFFVLTKGKYPKISIGEVALGKKAKIPDEINEFSRNLINRCWSVDPKDRPTFKQIVDEIKKNNFKLIDGIENDLPKINKFINY